MTRDELAATLNGREYLSEITPTESGDAYEAGLLVVFGASDDLTEFRGAMNDEATHVIGHGIKLIEHREEHDALMRDGWTPPADCLTIKAEWCPEGFDGSWRIGFDGPHSKFHIMEDGELYCEGIVIDVAEAVSVNHSKGI